MGLRVRWHSYAAVVIAGFLGAIFLSPLLMSEGSTLLMRSIVYCLIWAMLGAAVSVIWSDKGWRWGIWLMAPLWLLVVLSFAFTGTTQRLITRDAPLLLVATVAACAGAQLISRTKN